MSDALFPTLPGLKWGVVKTPSYSTANLRAASGRSTRGSFQAYPAWRFTLSYEFLRGGNGYDELQELVGFFNARRGGWDTFLYRDPSDYTVTDQALGVGDSVTTEFRFVRSLGGFVEPVLAPDEIWFYLDRGAALGKWRVSHEPRTNAFIRTEDLSNAYWTKQAGTVTVNAHADPQGDMTLDLFTEDTSTGNHSFYRVTSPTGGVGAKHVISWYVVPNGRTVVYCRSQWAGAGGAVFDLTGAGSVASIDAGVLSAGVRALSNGNYRVWITVRPTSASPEAQRLHLKETAGGSTSYTGDGASGVYAGWMQHETIPEDAPEEPTEYIPSTGGSATTVSAAFTLSSYGYFNFAAPPPSGVLLSWTGTFNFRVFFTHDSTEFSQFLQDLYEVRKVEFETDR